MNKKNFALILSASVLLLSACQMHISENREYSETVFAMDTVMTLKAYGKNAKDALSQAKERIYFLDSALDRKNEDSEIYKINETGNAKVSQATAELINTALDISESTDGAFDISIAPIMDLWGFYTKEFYVPDNEEVNALLKRVNYKNITQEGTILTLKNNSQIDLGGIAKGYLSDEIANIFNDCGVKSGIISLGGNVKAIGTKPDGSKWNIAIENPEGGSYIGYLSVADTAVVTSGGYQRYFEHDGKVYHHIIDPGTGFPSDSNLKSVSVISEDGTLADGLSTALFVMGLEKGTDYWRESSGFEVVFVTNNDEIYITKGLEDIFSSDYDFSIIEN